VTRLKALSILQAHTLALEAHGPAIDDRVQAAMSQEARDALNTERILPADWVDVSLGMEYLVHFDAVVGNGDGAAGAKLMRALARAQLGGVYRVVFLVSSVRSLIEKAGRIWSRFYDSGDIQIEWRNPHHASLHIEGCRDLPEHHEWFVLPYLDEIMRHAGATETQLRHTQCVAHGAARCTIEVEWK
jgi:hypothetical protein